MQKYSPPPAPGVTTLGVTSSSNHTRFSRDSIVFTRVKIVPLSNGATGIEPDIQAARVTPPCATPVDSFQAAARSLRRTASEMKWFIVRIAAFGTGMRAPSRKNGLG